MIKVELIDRMGTDLSVVNAARVSYAKTKEVFDAVSYTHLTLPTKDSV